jgi:hypothetical protein
LDILCCCFVCSTLIASTAILMEEIGIEVTVGFPLWAITVKADFEWHPQKRWGHPAFGRAS